MALIPFTLSSRSMKAMRTFSDVSCTRFLNSGRIFFSKGWTRGLSKRVLTPWNTKQYADCHFFFNMLFIHLCFRFHLLCHLERGMKSMRTPQNGRCHFGLVGFKPKNTCMLVPNPYCFITDAMGLDTQMRKNVLWKEFQATRLHCTAKSGQGHIYWNK